MVARATTVRAYDNGRDRWRIVAAQPDSALAGIVDGYGAWTEHTQSFTTRRELASAGGVFIVNLGAALEIVDAGGHLHRFEAGDGFVGGMAEATSLSRSTGAMAGVHIHVPLDRLAALAGVSIADLAGRVVPLGDLPRRATDGLGARIADAGDDESRFALLDAFVANRMASSRSDPAIGRAMRLLRRGGPRAVERTAAALGWSRKLLAHRLRDATGLLPHAQVRLARFERFTAALTATPGDSLAGLAAGAGYVDQPHLTRDVRRLADMTPAELRARLIHASGGVRDD